MRRLLLLILLLLATMPLMAQNFLARSEVGLIGGGMNYIGDLTLTPAGLLP